MTHLKLEGKPTFIRRTLASRRSCFTVFWAIAKLLVAALLLDMTDPDRESLVVPAPERQGSRKTTSCESLKNKSYCHPLGPHGEKKIIKKHLRVEYFIYF